MLLSEILVVTTCVEEARTKSGSSSSSSTRTQPQTSSTSTTTHAAPPLISVFDARSGAALGSYKASECRAHALAVVPRIGGSSSSTSSSSSSSIGLIAAQQGKAFLHLYRWSKEAIEQKYLCAERITALAVAHNGLWMAAGTDGGRLYFWDMLSGDLVKTVDVHYKRVSVVRFSKDDECVVTGSDDATVQVLFTADLADAAMEARPTPVHTLTGHALAITDVRVGGGSSHATARIITASLDRSVKLWNMLDGQCVATILMPTAVHAVAMDSMETGVWAACQDGNVYRVDFYRGLGGADGDEDEAGDVVSAAAAAGIQLLDEMTHVGASGELLSSGARRRVYPSPSGTPCTSIALSIDNTTLFAGYADGSLHIWDVRTRQVLQKIAPLKGGPVTNILTMLKPESLFNGAAKAGTRATDVVPKLKKTAVSGGGAGMGGMYGDVKTHVVMELGGYGGRDGVASTATAGFKLSASSQRTSAANSSDDAAALREQNERLLDECRRLKAVNTNLYQMALDGILSSSPASAATTPSVGK